MPNMSRQVRRSSILFLFIADYLGFGLQAIVGNYISYLYLERFLPALQTITGTPRWLPCKLKLDDLYGRLISGPKIGQSIGPLEAITYKIVFEFILIYAAYIMMAFSRKIATDLQRAAISHSEEI